MAFNNSKISDENFFLSRLTSFQKHIYNSIKTMNCLRSIQFMNCLYCHCVPKGTRNLKYNTGDSPQEENGHIVNIKNVQKI